MNPIVIQLANGNLFFAGLVMIVGALFFRLRFGGRISGFVLRTSLITGIIFVVFSAAPLFLWLYGLWFGISVFAALVVFGKTSSFQKKLLASSAALLCSAAMCLLELPFHLSPSIRVLSNQTVFVIGDSISAGISRKERPWPDALSSISHLRVVNLAKPAASVETAIDQCAGITETNSLVLLEIGGNNLLGQDDSKVFLTQLDRLLGRLKNGNHRVVMFELPLLPFQNRFGEAQRVLARKHGAFLIPKRFLTDVFALKDGTLDGLHLSQKGHDAMADSVYGLLKIQAVR